MFEVGGEQVEADPEKLVSGHPVADELVTVDQFQHFPPRVRHVVELALRHLATVTS